MKIADRLSDAEDCGYLPIRAGTRQAILDAWWGYCRERSIPYVWLRRMKTSDVVGYDFFNLPAYPSFADVRATLDETERQVQIRVPFRSVRQKRWIVGWYGEVTGELKLPSGEGVRLAKRLFRLGAPTHYASVEV